LSSQQVVWPAFILEFWYFGTKTPEKHVGNGLRMGPSL